MCTLQSMDSDLVVFGHIRTHAMVSPEIVTEPISGYGSVHYFYVLINTFVAMSTGRGDGALMALLEQTESQITSV